MLGHYDASVFKYFDICEGLHKFFVVFKNTELKSPFLPGTSSALITQVGKNVFLMVTVESMESQERLHMISLHAVPQVVA